MNEYIAQFKNTFQISPDDWEVVTPSLKINDATTIGEITKWMADVHRVTRVDDFRIIKLESIKKS